MTKAWTYVVEEITEEVLSLYFNKTLCKNILSDYKSNLDCLNSEIGNRDTTAGELSFKVATPLIMQNTKAWFNVNIYIKPTPRHVASRLVLSSPTSHQLLGDDAKAHQTGDVIPPVCPGPDPGVTSWLDMANEARCIYTRAPFNFHAPHFFSSREVWLAT